MSKLDLRKLSRERERVKASNYNDTFTKVNWQNYLRFLVFNLSFLIIFVGCGGGGGGNTTASITQGTAKLGNLANANVTIYRVEDNGTLTSLYTETTSSGTTLDKIGKFDMHVDALDDNTSYVYKVTGGKDWDANDDGKLDANGTVNKGTIRAIAKGSELKAIGNNFIVSYETELVYEQIVSNLKNKFNKNTFAAKLQNAIKKIIKDVNSDSNIDEKDMLTFDPLKDEAKIKSPYKEKLKNIKDTILNGQTLSIQNQPPTISITSNTNQVNTGETFTLTANATDLDGAVSSIVWYDATGNKIGSGTSINLIENGTGTYTFYAIATDNDGATAQSNQISIKAISKSEGTTPYTNENTTTSNNKTISGYVIDDPVVGATIKVYDPNGTLLLTKENATDSNGYFHIDIKADMNSSPFIIKVKNGYINNKYYNFELDGIATDEDAKNDIYITPLSHLVVQLLLDSEKEINSENINSYRELVKTTLAVDNLKTVPDSLANLLQQEGFNSTLDEIKEAIVLQKPNEKFSAIFPKSNIFAVKSELKNELSKSNIKIITNSNSVNEVNNTTAVVDAVAVDKNNSKIIAMSANVPSLKGKINFESTAMAIVATGLKSYLGLPNLDMGYIYNNIKDSDEFKQLVKDVKYGYENDIPLSSNSLIDTSLLEAYKLILEKKLVDIQEQTSTLRAYHRNKLTKKAYRKLSRNIEVFSYPFFTFKFKNSSSDIYTGNVELSIINPSYTGYGFTYQKNFFQDKSFSDILYVPYAKPFERLPKFQDLVKGKKATPKVEGKSEDYVFRLSEYQCEEGEQCLDKDCYAENTCWVGNFAAYNSFGWSSHQLQYVSILNSVYIASDLISLIGNMIPNIKSDKINKFINTIQTLNDKADELKKTIALLHNTLELSLTFANVAIDSLRYIDGLENTSDELYATITNINNKQKELTKLLKQIDSTLKLFNITPSEGTFKTRKIKSWDEELDKAVKEGNIFKLLIASKKHGIKVTDALRYFYGLLLYPKVNYKGKEYSFETFQKSKDIKKLDKRLVKAYVYFKLLLPNDKKSKTIKALDNILKNKQISVNVIKTVDVDPTESIINITDNINSILIFLNSWQNRGFYVNTKKLKKELLNFSKMFFSYIAAHVDEFIQIGANTLVDYNNLTTKFSRLAGKAFFAIKVTSKAVNVGYFVSSYNANPHIVPYTILAKKEKGKDKIKFESRISMDSIGYSLVYLLDEENQVLDYRNQDNFPVTVIAKEGYSFSPSMEIVFPKNILKNYLSKTLFANGNYVYNYQMFIQKDGKEPDLALMVNATKDEQVSKPNYAEFLYSYYFGDNDAYVSKINSPKILIDSIVQPSNESFEYIDIYDLLDKNDKELHQYTPINNTDYASFYSKKLTLNKSGVYKIKMRTDIAPPFTSYIKQKKVLFNEWSHTFNVIILKELPYDISNLTENYSFFAFANGDGMYFYQTSFPMLLSTNNEKEWKIIPIINDEIYTPNDGNTTTYIAKNIESKKNTKAYVYIIEKENYDNLSDVEITKDLLDRLAEQNIAFKKKIILKTNPFVVKDFSIKNNFGENDECTTTGKCVFNYDIDNIIDDTYHKENTSILVDFGDGTTQTFQCQDDECSGEITHQYSQSGEYLPSIKVFDTQTDEIYDKKSVDEKLIIAQTPLSKQYTLSTGQTLTLDASDVSGIDSSDIASVQWIDACGNVVGTTRFASVTSEEVGDYTLTLKVTDNDGNEKSCEVSISVQSGNEGSPGGGTGGSSNSTTGGTPAGGWDTTPTGGGGTSTGDAGGGSGVDIPISTIKLVKECDIRRTNMKCTFQKKCYSSIDPTKEIDCQNSKALHDDGWYKNIKQNCIKPDYTILSNNIIKDNITGIEWYSDDYLSNNLFQDENSAEQYCEQKGYHLPSIKDYLSIWDTIFVQDEYFNFIDYDAFYISTTEVNGDYFGVWDNETFKKNKALCVLKQQNASVSVAIVNLMKSYIEENITYLDKTFEGNWKEAVDYCDGLNYGGFNDWRLPNFNELCNIVDYNNYDPAVSSEFEHIVSDKYWSSTSWSDKKAYFINFTNVSWNGENKTTRLKFMCVRTGIIHGDSSGI